jgi:fructokinase
MESFFGGIEAGGTKFNCAIGTGPENIIAEVQVPTTTPEETLSNTILFFREYQSQVDLTAIGIASFGPVDLKENSPTYGYITDSPKPDWSQTPFVNRIQNSLLLPVGFDTDVNGALLGEHRWGAAKGYRDVIYLTIGTGIGGGAIVNGQLVHGHVHPEMGHILLPVRRDDPYPGGCPFHKNCFEGLANGPSLEERWGIKAETIPEDHPAWELEAHYIAAALHTLICTFSPKRIILGGGVMSQAHLFPMIQKKTGDSLNNYIQTKQITNNIDQYIVYPTLGGKAGVIGALEIAKDKILK